MSKQTIYEMEERFFSVYATKSKNSKGRPVYEEECPLRTDFQRDRDRIIHSKAFRQLKNKTQVFFSPEGDNYRTRLTHTLTVSQIARSIACSLDLNENLAEAIALGHDLGHTPFGHTGEKILDKFCPEGFRHNEQSLRVVDVLEKDGKGLNLTFEVRDGILNHKIKMPSATIEGEIVSIADWIAYINHDIEDAVNAGLIREKDLPEKAVKILGVNSRDRINNMIISIYDNSKDKPHIKMSEDMFTATKELRDFMFANVYQNSLAQKEEVKADRMLTSMFEFYRKNKDELPEVYKKSLEKYTLDRVICDYISGMSDRYATYVYESLFIPKSWGL